MNSSSPPPPPSAAPALEEKYDVFLNFRGEDTRDAFTSHLHAALLRKQIETYIDNRLEKGDDIGPSLLNAIERSKIALVIFSKNYASSTWCLKELVHILECKKSYGQIVIPIFYGVDPSHVRKQQGTCALDEDRPFKRSRDEVANCRAALEEAANMSGFPYSSETGTEADFVEKVAQVVLTKLNRESSSDLKGLFGIERKIEQIESLLCLDSPGACCVGIWGMGGIGKTTLADAVFHRQSTKFEAACFLANVRENSERMNGLNDLRNTLVREILKEKDVNIDTPSIPLHIQDRLRRRKALIVLDDVNARKQLEDLVGDHDRFCQGSRIIITARDKGLLEQKVDPTKIYNVEGLVSDEALELFHSHAFGNKSPTATYYTEMSREVVDYIKGIPLALKVMGSLFRRCRSKQEWEVQWKKVKQFPNEEIDQVLRISYDGLGKNEKDIFLDIACFHNGYNYVKELLDIYGEAGINDLIDRSLISISKGRIEMHDLLQEMSRTIAREERSRLFNADEYVCEVLTNNQRNEHVEAVDLEWPPTKQFSELQFANFKNMCRLRWLRVRDYYPLLVALDLPNSLRYLHWAYYPLESLPSKFSAQNLVVLNMKNCLATGPQLWNEDQSPVNLKWISLWDSRGLTEVPNLSRSPKIEHIDLSHCSSLVEIPSYFKHLGELTYLDLRSTAIEELPSSIWSHKKISHLNITYCRNLKSLPSNSCKLKLSDKHFSIEGCRSLCEFSVLPRDTIVLQLSGTSIKELPSSSIECLSGLTTIELKNCENLVSLPTNIWKLKSLESLDLRKCCKFQNFPEISEAVEHLKFLDLSATAIKELPASIGNLVALRKLDLSDCKNLEVVPDYLFRLTSLQDLNLSSSEIKSLPASIKQAAQLSRLCLVFCKSLQSLPELPPSLKTVRSSIKYQFSKGPSNKKYLERLDLHGCSNFQNFPIISEALGHLKFVNLTGTAVKEVPPSIGNLVELRILDLSRCKNLEVVPDYLFYLTSLQKLNLRRNKIKSIPASIKQAAQLSRMCLNYCKSLESLPELPPLLQCLKARGCTSLKTVSSSSTAITQGWEEYIFSRGLQEKYIFSDCPKLDENARSNIMADAQLRILRRATASLKVKEDKIEEKIEQASYDSDDSDKIEEKIEQASYDSDDSYDSDASYNSLDYYSGDSDDSDDSYEYDKSKSKKEYFMLRCWGYEIPKWFSHQSEGSSIKIELPRGWFSTDFLGFALSFVLYAAHTGSMQIVCMYNFKTSNGESHKVKHPLFGIAGRYAYALHVLWYNNVFEEVEEGAPNPTVFYNRFTEVNVDFHIRLYAVDCQVEKCGICLLYGKDAEMIKQRALYGQHA